MKIALIGCTGLIGTALIKRLSSENYLTVFYRSKESLSRLKNQLKNSKKNRNISFEDFSTDLAKTLINHDVIINLSGKSINCRWTASNKKQIFSSRIQTTNQIATAINAMRKKPQLWLNASAIGYYGEGTNGKMEGPPVDESFPASSSFMANLCKKWEEHARVSSSNKTTRICQLRFGVILSPDGGALKTMLPVYKLGLGGPVGKGSQGFSWIHIDDCVSAIEFIMKEKTLHGAINLTSPNPSTAKELSEALAKTLKKPHFLFVPSFLLGLFLSKGRAELMTKGLKIIPKKLSKSSFQFSYPHITQALQSLLAKA